MKEIAYEEIYDPEVVKNAILHTHEPFVKDYLCLHILLKKYNPKRVMEIGTHIGEGTQIICNALPNSKVFSLDLPPTLAHLTKQHPFFKDMRVGEKCKSKYLQLWGTSMNFDFSMWPCDAYFIDGEHDYAHPRHESSEALKAEPKLIIWHDADMPPVFDAINDAIEYNKNYDLFFISGTRIAYAIKKI